jgi:hypothetical protein
VRPDRPTLQQALLKFAHMTTWIYTSLLTGVAPLDAVRALFDECLSAIRTSILRPKLWSTPATPSSPPVEPRIQAMATRGLNMKDSMRGQMPDDVSRFSCYASPVHGQPVVTSRSAL